MKKKNYIVILLLIFITSCNSNKIEINLVDNRNAEQINFNKILENESLLMNDIVDSVKIVTLETKEECLVHEIIDIIVTDYRIFIYDNYQGGGIIIFDSDGNFIKRIKKGNGPGEINRVIGIDFDPYANGLIVLQNPFLQLFTINGDFVYYIMFDFPSDQVCCLENSLFFSKIQGHKCEPIENYEKYSSIITNRNSEVLSMAIPYTINYAIPNQLTRIGNNEIRIGVPGNDTIYTYKNDSLFASYVLDYSKYKYDMSKKTDEEIIEYESLLYRPNNCTYRGMFLETDTHQYFEFSFGHFPYSVYRNKNNGHMVSGYKFECFNDLICIPLPIKTSDNWFIALSNAFNYKKGSVVSGKYLSQTDIDKLEKLNEEDNPYLVFFKLKDF